VGYFMVVVFIKTYLVQDGEYNYDVSLQACFIQGMGHSPYEPLYASVYSSRAILSVGSTIE